jgi:hypothetical protein
MKFAPLIAFAGLAASGAAAQELPPITSELINVAAVVCIKVNDGGTIVDAFIVTSTGNAASDRALLAWVRQLRWNQGRDWPFVNRWWPMPVGFGSAARAPAKLRAAFARAGQANNVIRLGRNPVGKPE